MLMVTVVETPASEPGALPGWQATCECGLVMKNTMKTALEIDVENHIKWHEGGSK